MKRAAFFAIFAAGLIFAQLQPPVPRNAVVDDVKIWKKQDEEIRSGSRHDPVHHFAIHIGEPEIASGIAVSEAQVVDAEEVQDGGMEIMHVDLVLHRVVAELIRLAIRHAALHATAPWLAGLDIGPKH
jgi:hypothetical protein